VDDAPLYGTILALPVVFAMLVWLVARSASAPASSRGERRRGKESLPWGRLVVVNVLVFLLASSVVVAGTETYFRFVYDTTDSFGLTRTTKDWWNRHSKANSLAVRDNVEYALKRTPGKPRISFLGDSFTMAHGVPNVEDRFVNIIRRERPDWEVHSMAKSGLDTDAEMRLLNDWLRRGYEIDHLVLVYCLNDISDIVPEWNAIIDRIKGEKPGYLVEHSYLANVLYYRLRGMRDPDVSNYYHFVTNAYDGRIWQNHQARLARLKAIVEQHGGTLSVVTFPFLHALGPGYEYQHIHDKLAGFWASQGVPHLDLLHTFDGHTPRELTVNHFDAHPNELAHRLAATAIEKFLDEQVPRAGSTP
jgi:hypothetical protein